MTQEEFIQGIKLSVCDGAVKGTIRSLERPPGRKPDPQYVRRSEWYRGISDEDKSMVREVIAEASESAVFGFCCVLDGVRFVESRPDKGDFELYYVNGGERTRLNDPQHEELHNLFNWVTRNPL